YLVYYGVAGILYVLAYTVLIARSTFFRRRYSWSNSIISGIGMGLITYILPVHLHELFHILIIFAAIGSATTSGRVYTYINLLLIGIVSLPNNIQGITLVENALDYFGPFIISVIAVEIYLRLKDTTLQHIHRLETINKVSQQLMQSLDTEQVLSLLNATVLDTLDADTYFIGLLKGDDIQLELFYDDGEYYNGTK